MLETYSKPRVGMQRVREWLPDVVLLDIEMNGTSGIELARQLPPSCCLIFTTAFAHYALDGFEVNAVDFLHKPYFYERFDRAMQKAGEWLRMHDLLRTSESPARQLILKSEYKNVTVSVNTILYIESDPPLVSGSPLPHFALLTRRGHADQRREGAPYRQEISGRGNPAAFTVAGG